MARLSLARRLGNASLLMALAVSASACGGATTSADESTSSGKSISDISDGSGDLKELSADEFYPSVMEALQKAGTMNFSTTSTGAASMELTGKMRYAGDSVEMSAATTGAQAFEMVLLDKVLYISGASLPLPDGKKWVKVDLSDPNSLFGKLGESMDPSMMFKAMAVPKKFELLGTEEVDGVPTNHYNVVMDTASLTKAMNLPAEMLASMPKESAIEMWVDADNLPRKFHQEIEIADPTGSGTPIKSTTEGTYSDFGVDVKIEAPPVAEVADNIPGMS